MSNQCRIDVESMPNRPLRRGLRGRFEGGVQGPVPNKPLTKLASYRGASEFASDQEKGVLEGGFCKSVRLSWP